MSSPEKKNPETTWFTGVGYENQGIMYVTMSKEFDGLFPEFIERHGINPYGVWKSCDGDNPDREKTEATRKLIKEAELITLERTGFTLGQIREFHDKLSEEYRDKREAPFTFQLF